MAFIRFVLFAFLLAVCASLVTAFFVYRKEWYLAIISTRERIMHRRSHDYGQTLIAKLEEEDKKIRKGWSTKK